MLIVSTYETPKTVREMFTEYEIERKKYESNGSLVKIDSVSAYQMVTFYGVLRLIQLSAERAQKDAKARVFSLADIGSLFLFDRQKELVSYELSITKITDLGLKVFCCYHKNDFSLRLTKDQQAHLINHHNKIIISLILY